MSADPAFNKHKGQRLASWTNVSAGANVPRVHSPSPYMFGPKSVYSFTQRKENDL